MAARHCLYIALLWGGILGYKKRRRCKNVRSIIEDTRRSLRSPLSQQQQRYLRWLDSKCRYLVEGHLQRRAVAELSRGADGVNLIDENDARRRLLGCGKKLAYPLYGPITRVWGRDGACSLVACCCHLTVFKATPLSTRSTRWLLLPTEARLLVMVPISYPVHKEIAGL